jgi:hypothetical protein
MPTIEITTIIGCKNTCSYCPQNKLIEAYKKRSNVTEMSFDTFKECINKIPPEVDIDFTGMAEPWLNKDCTKMLIYAYKKGHKIGVSTTLTGMSPLDIGLLDSIKFKWFLVHLPSAELYEKINIDEYYLKILDKLNKSKIKIWYHYFGSNFHPEVGPYINKEFIYKETVCARAGNVKFMNKSFPMKKRGRIGCKRALNYNILFPNGDIILCCMDYSMKHVLGNLLSMDYKSLFCSDEFIKVKNGLKEDSLDTLCRYCDVYAFNVNFKAKFYNSFFMKMINIKRAYSRTIKKQNQTTS